MWGGETEWWGRRLVHTQSSEAFSMGLLAKEVRFGIGNLDCVSSNPQRSTSDQEVTVALMKVSEYPQF